ncbi:hypothetical protein [Cohnella faecalis]|uniref:hypothetical protein n=1 Tax=Cohnella faecalis TaxID=2315694 RepID=UPI001F29E45B|nr:hypothetical protein [Cohnella faecalis]
MSFEIEHAKWIQWHLDRRGRSYFVDFMWNVGGNRCAFEIMDYGSHGKDRSKYRLDLNRGLFLQSQQYQVIAISFDEPYSGICWPLSGFSHKAERPGFTSVLQN